MAAPGKPQWDGAAFRRARRAQAVSMPFLRVLLARRFARYRQSGRRVPSLSTMYAEWDRPGGRGPKPGLRVAVSSVIKVPLKEFYYAPRRRRAGARRRAKA